MNVEEERYAQARFVERARRSCAPRRRPPDDPEWLAAKIPAALERFERARATRIAPPPASASCARSRSCGRSTARSRSSSAATPRSRRALEQAHKEIRDRLIVLATHMHAGDGNVHVNVPVLSNDRPMLQRAEQVIDRVMEKVIALGGVVSGEHGIGVTKLKYLEPERHRASSRPTAARSTPAAS